VSEVTATECVERVAGRQVDLVWELSAGQSSSAWVAQAGEERWVVRVPVKDSGRRITYRAETAIGRYLTSLGHPVADWTLVEHDGTMCSVAREIPGVPVAYDRVWSDDFGCQLAHVLSDLHEMPAEGFGPLADDQRQLMRGLSEDRVHGITDRWFHARIWPFDGSSVDDHPITDQAPDIAHAATTFVSDIAAAGTGAIGVVHSDLHREHLLVGNDGSLNGVLDFGDAFIGSIAWDFALLNWYYGKGNASTVARHHPAGSDALDQGVALSIAVGLYKVAKNPHDLAVLPRLRRCLESA
jgi:aminoglycoside phosphotransferase (APT) family kinase protein